MFSDIPSAIQNRMHFLEELDAKDRLDGTARMERLRQIPPETGKFLALLAAGTPPGEWIEIGTSAGYSTLWLALAARQASRRLKTFEILKAKADLARKTFEDAGVNDVVEFFHADALEHLKGCTDIAFCFLDAEKEIYADCYEAVIPSLVPGGLLIADNAINHASVLQPMLDRALCDDRIDAMIVPVGKGELLCRKKET